MKKSFKFLIILGSIILVFGIGSMLIKNRPDQFRDNFPKDHKNMIISSPAFADSQAIPDDYGCHGQNINPPLKIEAIPAETKSLVLLVDDPDAPAGDWVHWLVWNINPTVNLIEPHSIPSGASIGLNDFGTNRYDGPCPPRGVHRYQFKVYALDVKLDLASTIKKPELLRAMAGHILDQAVLAGTYSS